MAAAPYTPETPGASVEFIKPNVPDCWTPQPVKSSN